MYSQYPRFSLIASLQNDDHHSTRTTASRKTFKLDFGDPELVVKDDSDSQIKVGG